VTLPLRVLIVEDNADDANLVVRLLKRAGFDVTSRRVDDAAGLSMALEDACEWDIVLSDYNMPGFNGMDALNIVNAHCRDIPLVLVSGAIDVPAALEIMKAGARDFVPKGDPQRLPSVIEREIAEAAQRRERRLIEAERDLALAELREANQQLTAFARLTDVPLHGTTQKQLLDDLLQRLVSAIRSDGATIIMLTDHGLLVSAGAVGPLAGVASGLELGCGFAGTIAALNTPIHIRDAYNDERVVCQATRDSGIRTMLGVPMHYGGKVIGVLHADWLDIVELPAWKLPLLELAADRCAMAIENARLYAHEHMIADTLQQALLSASTSIPGLEIGHSYGSATVATLVGGDFYDVFETGPESVAFSIGDVSGKGLDAASVTALIKNSLRALAIEGHSPELVMCKGNEIVSQFTATETFVTAIYGALDVATGEVTYCSAGHPPPAVVGPEGVRMLNEHGPLLGAWPGVLYSNARARLLPGESLVLYTDGLTEARSSDGSFYGEEHLEEFLATLGGVAPQDIAARVFEEVWEFSGGKLRDDVAILVIRLRVDSDGQIE